MSGVYDALIAGAGPAGSAAAVVLGRAGYRVLLLDRSAFPRDKPCGDLIGARAMAAAYRLGMCQADVADYPPLAGATIVWSGGELNLAARSVLGRRLLAKTDARVIPRRVFDHLLVRRAESAEAELRQGTVRDAGDWDGGVRLVGVETSAGAETIAARAVIVAGGYGCQVAAGAAPRSREDGPARGIAMRGYFHHVNCPPDRIVFSLDRWLLPGYGWVFPLAEGGANVGVGTLVSDGGEEREHLHDLWRRFTEDATSPAAVWLAGAKMNGRPRTWALDLGPRRRRLVGDGLAIVGEAAGLVGPLTGAGIAFALESGELAGTVIAAALAAGDASRGRLRPYSTAIRRRIAPWLRAELLAQRYLSDPERVDRFFAAIRPLPPTGALGARLLLHLG
ncbi:MAG: geranylgeranyl reductase family protein [Chloroflexota bacterium]|nr:geranylgeranyl reductase family protein [Chloroflexia bacterium]MDQ3226935.1 geranylgeranyl reductase family protein [Chloroflexota bacterium]